MTTSTSKWIPFVIVGGGLAAAKAAEALREEGADGQIVALAAEPDRPYQRPPLSKDLLRGETPRDDVFVHPADWADAHGVELRLGAVAERLHLGDRSLTVRGADSISFHRLLLATGATPRQLTIPGADLDGVHTLRTLADAERIRAAARGKRRAVMIGGDFIAAEVAASRRMGLETTLVTRDALAWSHLFGDTVGGVFQGILADNGVEILNGDEAVRIEGDRHVSRVVTRRGRVLACDLVVAGVGVRPETGLVDATPVRVDDGVVTDEYLRTSVPGIYAAGDVARYYSSLYGRHPRVEHYEVAEHHGAVAGRNMAREAAGREGEREPFVGPPYFFSDLFDLAMEYLGHNEGWDEVVVRGQLWRRDGTAFYLKKGRLVAALFVNRNQDVDPTRALIRARRQVDEPTRARMADATVDLAALAA
jgi:3-phenylpropionate/trans-cinnamate dioxygenase ferredoxin reductase subunit